MARKSSLPIMNRIRQTTTGLNKGQMAAKRALPTRSTVRRQLKIGLTGRKK